MNDEVFYVVNNEHFPECEESNEIFILRGETSEDIVGSFAAFLIFLELVSFMSDFLNTEYETKLGDNVTVERIFLELVRHGLIKRCNEEGEVLDER